MKRFELWENVILLVSAILLLPIWLAQSRASQLAEGVLSLYQILQGLLVIILGVILVRRVRRIMIAMRDNKNRQGPFPF